MRGFTSCHLRVLAVEKTPPSTAIWSSSLVCFLWWPSPEKDECTGLEQPNRIFQSRFHKCTGTPRSTPNTRDPPPGTMSCMMSDTVHVSDKSWPWHQTSNKRGEAKSSMVRSQPKQGYWMLSKAVRAPFPCSEHITRASKSSVCCPWKRTAPPLNRWHRKHDSMTSTKH